MTLKDFVNLDDWNDSHVWYQLCGFVDKDVSNKKVNQFMPVPYLSTKTFSIGDNYLKTIILHLMSDASSERILHAPCPADLLQLAKATNRISPWGAYYLLYEYNGKYYEVNEPQLVDKNMKLCTNPYDEEICFDVGKEVNDRVLQEYFENADFTIVEFDKEFDIIDDIEDLSF